MVDLIIKDGVRFNNGLWFCLLRCLCIWSMDVKLGLLVVNFRCKLL